EHLLDQLTERRRTPGHKHFWRSDFTAHHRPGWSMSIKMCSTRTAPTETGNGEGLLSWYLGEGITPVWITGEEYRDIYPLWNWRRLPGLTAEQSDAPLPELDWHRAPDGSVIRGGRDEVGGLGEGGIGIATMRLAKDAVIDGRKSWFCLEDEFVALGAGIAAPDTSAPVWTTINQCHSDGPVRQGPGWVHHAGIGYLVLDGKPIVQTAARAGNWSRIGVAQSAEPLTGDITTIAIDHGPAPREASYAYIVVPGCAEKPESSVTVLRNDPAVQAVRSPKATQIAFHQAGEAGGIAVDAPALVQLRGNVLSVADHTRRGGAVTVRIGDRTVALTFAEGGATVSAPLA
ncbi:MAG TPA: polysaccharide lyase family 8 super-sandwich domain-containing protein, partial [Mycobacteriales bacterium]|nr:polysaccharide lyase family 8 super-sandwich domain-containing protein [Mycobacteriales bacterium]